MYAPVTKGRKNRSGAAVVLAIVFVLLFSTMALAIFSISSMNVQVASNHHDANGAMNAAQSGLEIGRYLLQKTPTFSTTQNVVGAEDADRMWASLCQTVQEEAIGGATVVGPVPFADEKGSGQRISTGEIALAGGNLAGGDTGAGEAGSSGGGGGSASVNFSRYDSNPNTVEVEATGTQGGTSRTAGFTAGVGKQAAALEYAVLSRGRVWITESTVIEGSVYSGWGLAVIGSGVETGPDTQINGRIATRLAQADLLASGIHMETLDADGNPQFDAYGQRISLSRDVVRGRHEGIRYGVDHSDLPGLRYEDYDTTQYKQMCGRIGGPDGAATEFFPHAAGDYNSPKFFGAKELDRSVYEGRTFRNVLVPRGTHPLFIDCTFEGILFIEAEEQYSDRSEATNNVRFEDCTFHGLVVSDVPRTSYNNTWWMRNVLYFTGESRFDNRSQYPETAILAPNFNVNLGNTGRLESDGENVVSGAVVGGIVDIRGNATIRGTVISMYDTSQYPGGYVTNIGTAEDGGKEGAGYSGGQIRIVPNADQLLPDGIDSRVVIQPMPSTYRES